MKNKKALKNKAKTEIVVDVQTIRFKSLLLFHMAGAGGFEPATHGFGVAIGNFDTSRMLAFSAGCGHLEAMLENSNLI